MNFFHQMGNTFVNPWFLVLLLLIPLLAYLKGYTGGVPAVVFSSISPLKTLGKSAESKAGDFMTGLNYLGLALLIIALARPRQGTTVNHIEASGIDIMICLDVSGSMLMEDYNIGGQRASRIDTVKEVTRKFIEGRPNDRIGIIAFGGQPYIVSPLTLDHDWLFQNLDRVQIGLVKDSTAIGSAIAAAANRLKDRPVKSKVIILLTDGENNAGKISPETAAEAAKMLGLKFYAIGAGTNDEAPYPVQDSFGRKRYITTKVPFNEAGLKKVTQIANGKYYRAADTESLDNIFADIDKLEKSKAAVTYFKNYRDLFPWFLGAGLLVLCVNAVLSETIWRKLP